MDFPPKKAGVRRTEVSPTQSATKIRSKLLALAARHEQVKIAHHQLHSQIKICMLEAGEIFASLAIPLTKLVGLKTMEMAGQGRFTSIIVDVDFPSNRDYVDGNQCNSKSIAPISAKDGVANNQIHNMQFTALEKESYFVEASRAGKEILEKQQTQLIQLLQILRQIETEVNSRENKILHMAEQCRTTFQIFLQKAIYYINALHSHNHDTFKVTIELLRTIFNNIGEILGSVESGVEDLMQALAEKMCNPMRDYVSNLKADIKFGGCAQLISIVKDMERVIGDKRQELEEARKRVRVAEQAKIKALSKLKETDERARRLNECLRLQSEAQKRQPETAVSHKCFNFIQSQANDEKLLWELLKKKRQEQTADSPLASKFSRLATPNSHHNNTHKPKPLFSHKPTTRSQSRLLSPRTPLSNGLIPLGSSPSTATVCEARASKRHKS